MSVLRRLIIRFSWQNRALASELLLLAMGIILTLHYFVDAEPEGGADKVSRELVKRVVPGLYNFRACNHWRFAEQSEELLQSFSSALLAEAGDTLLTSNHVSIPICLLAREGSVLVNPQISQRYGNSRVLETRVPELCYVKNSPPFQSQFSDRIELAWRDQRNVPHKQMFSGPEALRLQKALEILSGADVCNSGKQ